MRGQKFVFGRDAARKTSTLTGVSGARKPFVAGTF